MSECIVGAFPKSKTEMILGTISPYGGKVLAHLRTAVPSAESEGEWVRTRKGVALPVTDFPPVLDALNRLNGVAAASAIGGRIPKAKGIEIRILLEPFQGDVYCHIREYYLKENSPGRGIAVKAHLLPDLLDLVASMVEAINDRCWESNGE